MPQDIRVWKVQHKKLSEISKAKLNLEERLEDWLKDDISMISDDLLVIGRQVRTDFEGYIDLLCLDYEGNTVIIELKRDRTPREISAQCLDYASWVRDLSNVKINEIADKHLDGEGILEDAFKRKFGTDMPESLNNKQRIFIVGSEIDSSTERIISYLSDMYGVDINAVTFQYFQDGVGNEFLSRVFLVDPEKIEYKSKTKTGARPSTLSFKELQEIADEKGVGGSFTTLVGSLREHFDGVGTTQSSVAFSGKLEGKMKTLFSLIPGESSSSEGLRFQFYSRRLSVFWNIDEAKLRTFFPQNLEEWYYIRGGTDSEYSGFAGFFKDVTEVETFLNHLKDEKKR